MAGTSIKPLGKSPGLAGMLMICVLACFAGEARGVLVSYEGFDYAPGAFANMADPGPSWNGDWSVNAATTLVVAGSLSHPSGSAYTTGNHLEHTGTGSTSGMNHTITFGSAFNYNMSEEGTVRYASMVVGKSATGASSGEYIQLSLGNSGGTTWMFGLSSAENFFVKVSDPDERTVNAGAAGTVTANTSYLLVSKLVTSASGLDTVYLNWYSGNAVVPTTEPTTWMYSLSFDNKTTANQTLMRLETGNAAGTTFRVDEIRLGTTWLDVIPEPGRAMLLLLGGVASLLARRRF
jgi:hypothetical protein